MKIPHMKMTRRGFLKGASYLAALAAIPTFLAKWKKDKLYVKAKAFTWFGLRKPDGSAKAPFQTLQAAINAAESIASDGNQVTIFVAPGVYAERLILPDYVSITGSSRKYPVIKGGIELSGMSSIKQLSIHGDIQAFELMCKGCIIPVKEISNSVTAFG